MLPLGFRVGSIPARGQWLQGIRNLSFFNRVRLESSRNGGACPWRSDHSLDQVRISDAAVQMYFASGTLKQMCSLGSQVFDVETLALANFRWFTLKGKGELQSAFQDFLLSNPYAL